MARSSTPFAASPVEPPGARAAGRPVAASPAEILACRETRDLTIRRLARGGTLLFAGLNVPGARKDRGDLDPILARGLGILLARLGGARVAGAGRDALGPWLALRTTLPPAAAKRIAVSIEESIPGGRLLDLDVYDASSRPVDRSRLGIPPRSCFVCGEPARACTTARRHDLRETREAFHALLARAR